MQRPLVYFLIWILCLFAATPFARLILDLLRGAVGREGVVWLVCASAVLLLAIFLFRRPKDVTPNLLSLLILGAGFSGGAYLLRRRPEEIVHLIQYGVLSVLALAVLKKEAASFLIHISAVVLSGSIGILEELFQWVLPNRVFDYRDIGVNIFAAAAVQLALFLPFHFPNASSKTVRLAKAFHADRESIATLVETLLLFSLLAFLCLLLTPRTVNGIVSLFPRLSYLQDETVTNFGWEGRTREGVSFRSHFSDKDRSELDRNRGDKISLLIQSGFSPRDGVNPLPPDTIDPFLHEVAVRLLRRDIYFKRFSEDPKRLGSARTALGEEFILREFYPHSTGLQRLVESDLARLQSAVGKNFTYRSPVAKHLFTKVNQDVLQLFFAGIIILLSAFSLCLRNQRNDCLPPHAV